MVTPIQRNNSEILNPSVNCNLIDSPHECLEDMKIWPYALEGYINEKILEEGKYAEGFEGTHRPCSFVDVARGSTIVIGDYVNQTPRYTPLQFA